MITTILLGFLIGVTIAAAFVGGYYFGARDSRFRATTRRVKELRLPRSQPLIETLVPRGIEHPSGPPPPPPGSERARNWAARFTGGVR